MQGVKFCRTLVGPTPTARRGDRAAARSRAGTQTAAERGRARNIIAAKEQRGAQLGQGHNATQLRPKAFFWTTAAKTFPSFTFIMM